MTTFPRTLATAAGRTKSPTTVTVALCGVEFGWGSAGKLGAIVHALRAELGDCVRFVGLGSRLGREIVRGHGVEEWHDVDLGDTRALRALVDERSLDAAVCVLDRTAAVALEDAGCPVVFVDSLPFLWTKDDLDSLPLRASAYCAQLVPGLPGPAWPVLARVENLRWVESVVVPGPVRTGREMRRAGERHAVVSLGGLLSPLLDDPSAYLSLTVPAALDALAAWGTRQVTLCGNVPEGVFDGITVPAGLDVRSGALDHQGFLTEIAEADVLLTSPGLTTLLETSTRGVPVVCLPPQNISQILNASFYAQATEAPVAEWPEEVFCAQEVLDARLVTAPRDVADGDGSPGEDAALELIYGGIARAARTPAPVRAALTERIGACLDAVERHQGQWSALARLVGTGGAAQVTDIVLATAARRGTRHHPADLPS
ncbi:hydroxymethylcytosylglucuronate/cytosylglucuronate synthase [Streptomyces sp. NPDC096012]|uniref:hydroxymethylcytosylglucuronate/cytosylglucurona te synthase n=1 Tax=Streptomyces sp. NPDC096012 TaxID=3155684 RepID=UPI003369FCBD